MSSSNLLLDFERCDDPSPAPVSRSSKRCSPYSMPRETLGSLRCRVSTSSSSLRGLCDDLSRRLSPSSSSPRDLCADLSRCRLFSPSPSSTRDLDLCPSRLFSSDLPSEEWRRRCLCRFLSSASWGARRSGWMMVVMMSFRKEPDIVSRSPRVSGMNKFRVATCASYTK